jgi:hypothetical protein
MLAFDLNKRGPRAKYKQRIITARCPQAKAKCTGAMKTN